MRKILIGLGIILMGLSAAPEEMAPELQKKIEGLIQQLGNDEWAIRESATKELIDIGEPAVEFVKEVLKSEDKEVQIRAKRILETINTNSMYSLLGDPLKDVKTGEWVKYKVKYQTEANKQSRGRQETVIKMSVIKTTDKDVTIQTKPEKDFKMGTWHMGALSVRLNNEEAVEKTSRDKKVLEQLEEIPSFYDTNLILAIKAEQAFKDRKLNEEEIEVQGKKWKCIRVELITCHGAELKPAGGRTHPYQVQVTRTYWFNKDGPLFGIIKMQAKIEHVETGALGGGGINLTYLIISEAELVSYGTEEETK